MNPADIAQSALPLTSSDLSLFSLFWQAHWVVKTVMIGLLICSVWVWAIAIDKVLLLAEFDQFMADRRNRPADAPPQPQS